MRQRVQTGSTAHRDNVVNLLHTGKDLLRMNELAAILLKYGFADVIRRLGLSTPVEHAVKLVRSSMKPDMLLMGTSERL